jgi:glycosyltransferase involved in cell wall biosynthesis
MNSNPQQLDVEVVVPVYNEEATLDRSIRRLHAFLAKSFPFSWRIVIADNASTDGTLKIARRLADYFPGVEVLHLERKGRGLALRSAWSASDARVVCYMDVDLSTDLRALLPLVAPLLSGHSEVAIGTRLARGSRIVRSAKRELISRSYNRILRLALRAGFTDAQCGFKAVRTDVLREGLLDDIRDDGWFFDTELLVLAERRGLRIHEVPVDWVEDLDSRVQIVSTALDDLRGVGRLMAAASGARFAGVVGGATLVFVPLYLVLRGPLGPLGANAAALAASLATLTLATRGRRLALQLGIYVYAVGLTSDALAVLHNLGSSPSRASELIVLGATYTVIAVFARALLRAFRLSRPPESGGTGVVEGLTLRDLPRKRSVVERELRFDHDQRAA